LNIDFASTLFQLDFVNSLTVYYFVFLPYIIPVNTTNRPYILISRFLVKQHEVKYGLFVVFTGIIYGKKTK
jgi:hypothetical protein